MRISPDRSLIMTNDSHLTDKDGTLNRPARCPRAKQYRENHHKQQTSKPVGSRTRTSKYSSVPSVQPLHTRLPGQPSQYLRALEILFLEMAKQDSFTQFAGALRFLRSHERIRLPQVSEDSVALLCSLDTIDNSQHAITLLRAMALIRFQRHYLAVKGDFKNTGSCILHDTNKIQRKRRLQAAVLDVLVNEAQECYIGQEVIKTRKRIKNFLTASRSWSCLHKAFGSGSFALIPRIAASQ